MTSVRRVSTRAIITFAALAGALVAAAGCALGGGWSADGAGAAARLTARFSLLWFVTAWSASALAALWPGGWRGVMLRRRRAIGLGFAAAHVVHLAALLIAVLVFAAPTTAKTVYGGGFGYVLIAAMALTSNDWSVRALGPRNWKLLHMFSALAIAGVFTISYVGRLDEKAWLAIPALTLLGGAAVLKLMAWAKTRALRAA